VGADAWPAYIIDQSFDKLLAALTDVGENVVEGEG
jgi:hypothetical protein